MYTALEYYLLYFYSTCATDSQLFCWYFRVPATLYQMAASLLHLPLRFHFLTQGYMYMYILLPLRYCTSCAHVDPALYTLKSLGASVLESTQFQRIGDWL